MRRSRPANGSALYRLATAVGLSYFLLAPLPQVRVELASVPVVPFLGVSAFVLWLMVERCRAPRLYTSQYWTLPLLALGMSITLGYFMADDYAKPSIVRQVVTCGIPIALVGALPREANLIMQHWKTWVAGVCLSALSQIRAGIWNPMDVGAYFQYSTSRYLQTVRDVALTQELGITNTFGYMTMAICAGSCLSLMAMSQRLFSRWLLLIITGILCVGTIYGGYLAATLVLVTAITASTVLTLVNSETRRGVVWPVISVVAFVGVAAGFSRLDIAQSYLLRATSLSLSGLSGDPSTYERWSLSVISFNAFLSSPIWGIGLQGWVFDAPIVRIGGHSSALDVPAQLGVVGFLAYYGFMVPTMIRSWHRWQSGVSRSLSRHAIVVGGIASTLMASLLNPSFLQPLMNETLLLLVALGLSYDPVPPGGATRRQETVSASGVPVEERSGTGSLNR